MEKAEEGNNAGRDAGVEFIQIKITHDIGT